MYFVRQSCRPALLRASRILAATALIGSFGAASGAVLGAGAVFVFNPLDFREWWSVGALLIGTVGAVLGPAVAWLFLRRISLWLAMAYMFLATLVVLTLASWLRDQAMAMGVVLFGIIAAIVALRLWQPRILAANAGRQYKMILRVSVAVALAATFSGVHEYRRIIHGIIRHTLNVRKLPRSLGNVHCASYGWSDLLEACNFTIEPSDAPALLIDTSFREYPCHGSMRNIIPGPPIGEDFAVAHCFKALPKAYIGASDLVFDATWRHVATHFYVE